MATTKTYHDETGVDEDKGPGAADAGAAVDHRRPVLGAVQAARRADGVEKLQKGVRALRQVKVRPVGVVEVQHLAAAARL